MRVTNPPQVNIPSYLYKKQTSLGIADIGRVGWYSGCKILDLSGLVNGRYIAEAKGEERITRTLEKFGFPDYLVLKLNDLGTHWDQTKLFLRNEMKQNSATIKPK